MRATVRCASLASALAVPEIPPAGPAPAPSPAAPPPASGTSFTKIVFGVACGGCLLLAIIAVVVLALFGNVARKAKERMAAEAQRMDALPASSVTWEEVEAAFGPESKATGVQKDDAWAPYEGKKVRWRGWVLGVNEVLRTTWLQVRLNPEARVRAIVISDALIALAPGEEANAAKLAPQAEVTFEGVLDRHNQKIGNRVAIVTLKNGRIVE